MRRRRSIGSAVLIGFASLLGACTSPAPTLPVATPSPVAAAAFVVCPSNIPPGTALTCNAAVEVAVRALPAGLAPVRRIEFYYGTFCSTRRACLLMIRPNTGYVVFRTAGRNADWFVAVAADGSGRTSVASRAEPYPGGIPDPRERQLAAT